MIKLIVGTQTGTAEFVADEIADALSQQGIDTDIQLEPELTAPAEKDIWIICTSTHGAGDVPDNLQPFFTWLKQQKPDLSSVKHIMIGIGDSSYDTFCKAATDLSKCLIELNSTPIFDLFTADAMDEELPEDLILAWLEPKFSELLGHIEQ